MDNPINPIKMNASAVSHTGMVLENNADNFYIDGRFKHKYEIENIQVSMGKSADGFMFAVFDDMSLERVGEKTSFSLTKELKKLHDQLKNDGRNIESKINKLSECVEGMGNLIYSASLDDTENKVAKTSFAGLVLSDNKAAAISTGGSKVYLLRGGILKHMTNDDAKIERLLKLGIITPGQAKVLLVHSGDSTGTTGSELSRSETGDIRTNDIFLLCSDGLSNVVDDGKIQEILSDDEDTGLASNMLVKEALENGGEDNITALVIRIEEAGSKERSVSREHDYQPRRPVKPARNRGSESAYESVKTYVAAAVTFIIIAGFLYLAYRTWFNSNKELQAGDIPAPASTVQEAGTDETADSVEETTQQAAETTGPVETTVSAESGEAKAPVEYVVMKGDTLFGISKKFYNDPDKYKLIMEKNNIENPDYIKAGQVLIIP